MFQAILQEKYNTLKYPEVVRSQIETYERLWGNTFVESDTLTANLHGIAKSREIRKQKWFHILTLSPHSDVTFLRKLILFNNLDEKKYFSKFKGNYYKSVKNKTGYHKYVELNTAKRNIYEKLKTMHLLKRYYSTSKIHKCQLMSSLKAGVEICSPNSLVLLQRFIHISRIKSTMRNLMFRNNCPPNTLFCRNLNSIDISII